MKRLERRVKGIEGCLLNFQIALAVLSGESQRSVARRFDLDQADIRLRIIRFCMTVNPVLFQSLGRPSLDQLRHHRTAFFPASVLENGSQLWGAGKVTEHVTRHLFLMGENFSPETGVLRP
jgi:hypothetical protein